MLHLSPSILSSFYSHEILAIVTQKCQWYPEIYIRRPSITLNHNKPLPVSLHHSTFINFETEEENFEKEESKIKWHDVGPDLTDAQKQAISQLPPKMTNRCEALMKRLICFSPEDEDLSLLLAAWVKVMKPRRADWLSILKEMQSSGNPLLLEVMELALLEESYEVNVRDYTKLIDTYAKHNRIESAENAFRAMQNRGFSCDQVTLTVLINMYSKAGDLKRARGSFQEIELLGLLPDKRAYGSMIMAYVRAGELHLAESLMKEMESKEVYAGREVYKALLRAFSTAGDADGAQRVFDAIQFARIVPDSKLCALLINAYCVCGDSEKARSVLENMRSVGLKPSDKCIALVLGAYERENRLDRALGLMMDVESGGVAIGEEVREVLERWFERIGVADDDEVQLGLRSLSSEMKGRAQPHQQQE